MQVILITGTSKGLGRSLARRYLEKGAMVIGISRNKPDIDSKSYHHLVGSVTDDHIVERLENLLSDLPLKKKSTSSSIMPGKVASGPGFPM